MTNCLFIIDVQRGFINEHTRHIPQKVEALQHNYENIIVTQFINSSDTPHATILGWRRFMPQSPEITLAFTPRDNAHIISKNRYGCVDDGLVEWLNKRNIETVDICGIDTDMCVLKNAIDLFENNVRPRILSECCASHAGREYHDAALMLLRRAVGEKQVI